VAAAAAWLGCVCVQNDHALDIRRFHLSTLHQLWFISARAQERHASVQCRNPHRVACGSPISASVSCAAAPPPACAADALPSPARRALLTHSHTKKKQSNFAGEIRLARQFCHSTSPVSQSTAPQPSSVTACLFCAQLCLARGSLLSTLRTHEASAWVATLGQP
jgi:hypothetical protein